MYLKTIMDFLKGIVPIRKSPFTPVRVRQGYFEVSNGYDKFCIEDYHMSGDYTGPMKFNKEDADKVARFLNTYYIGIKYTAHWRIYDRMKEQLNLTTGTYSE